MELRNPLSLRTDRNPALNQAPLIDEGDVDGCCDEHTVVVKYDFGEEFHLVTSRWQHTRSQCVIDRGFKTKFSSLSLYFRGSHSCFIQELTLT
jgi:hypothetical protein